MLSFKEKRTIQKEIKSNYELLEAEKGFKAKRDLQKTIKGLYAKLSEKSEVETVVEPAVNSDRFYLSSGGAKSDWNNTKSIIKDKQNRTGNNTDEIAGYVRYDADFAEINDKYKDNQELISFLKSKGLYGESEEETELKATINFNTPKDAQEFATAYSRKTLRGHTVGGSKVEVYGLTDEDKEWVDDYVANMNKKIVEQEAPIDPSIIERLGKVRDVLQSDSFTLQDLNGLNRSITKIEEVESSLLNNDLYNEVIGLYKQAIDSRGVTIDSIDGGLFDTVEMDGWFKRKDKERYRKECIMVAQAYYKYHQDITSLSEYMAVRKLAKLLSNAVIKQIENIVMKKKDYKEADVVIFDAINTEMSA